MEEVEVMVELKLCHEFLVPVKREIFYCSNFVDFGY